MRNDPNYPSLRQAAKRGPLSEHYLRLLLKQGKLPGFYVGSYFRVNYPMLLKQLEEASVPNANFMEKEMPSARC